MTLPTKTEFEEAKADLDDLEAIVNGGVTVSTRIGGAKQSITQLLSQLGYQNPVAYAGSISFTTGTQTIERSGIIYAPLVASLPFTSSGTWAADDENKFHTIAQDDAGIEAALGRQLGQKQYQYHSSAASASHAGIATGYIIKGDFFDSNHTAGSGASFAFTNTTTAGKAGNWPDADGYFYDADGKQFEVQGSPVNVRWFGVTGDGTTDDAAAFQIVVDSYLNIYIPEGTYLVNATIIIHDRAGLKIRGADEGATIFTSSATMVIDTSRIQAKGITDFADYAGESALFLITEYDGENNRFNFSARGHYFEGFQYNLDGTSVSKLVDVVSSPSLSFTKFRDLKARYCKSLYHGFFLSDGSGTHYHLEWNNCRTEFCVEHTFIDWSDSTSPHPCSHWLLRDNSVGTNDNGYKLQGMLYSTMDSCSVDNNAHGSYAIFLEKCRGLTIISTGIETRYIQAGAGYGAGVFKAVDSSVTWTSSLAVAGDRDANGSGVITDYDDGSGTVTNSLLVLDNSVLEVFSLHGDLQKGASSSVYWPWYLVNASRLRYHQSKSVLGDIDSHFDINDTSTATIFTDGGETKHYTATTVETEARLLKGTWTPVISDASTGGNVATATVAGYYSKIGNQVTVHCQLVDIDTTGMTGGNDIYIQGLPFAMSSFAGLIRTSAPIHHTGLLSSNQLFATIQDAQQYIRFGENVSGVTGDFLTVAEITSPTSDVYFSVTYEVD